MVFNVQLGLCLNYRDVRAAFPGVPDRGSGFDTECLRPMTGGYCGCAFRQHRRDDNGLATKFWIHLLLAGSEEAVHVNEQPA